MIDRKDELREATRKALAHAQQVDARQPRQRSAGARPRWHVVHVAYKFERDVELEDSFIAQQIRAVGFEVYSPKTRRMVMPRSQNLSRAQRKYRQALARPKIEPMFPRYEFLRFDPLADPWQEIFRLVGVHGMICANNQPVPVPDGFIEMLRSREVEGAIPAELPIAEVFAVGELVRIRASGPFAGMTGTIERVDADRRIRLLFGLLGGAAVSLTADDVEKI